MQPFTAHVLCSMICVLGTCVSWARMLYRSRWSLGQTLLGQKNLVLDGGSLSAEVLHRNGHCNLLPDESIAQCSSAVHLQQMMADKCIHRCEGWQDVQEMRMTAKVKVKVKVDLYSASRLIQTSNALERSLVIWDHTMLPATRQQWFSRLYHWHSPVVILPSRGRWKAEST